MLIVTTVEVQCVGALHVRCGPVVAVLLGVVVNAAEFQWACSSVVELLFRGFDSRLAHRADIAQLVEQFLRKDQVTGSTPVIGSIL